MRRSTAAFAAGLSVLLALVVALAAVVALRGPTTGTMMGRAAAGTAAGTVAPGGPAGRGWRMPGWRAPGWRAPGWRSWEGMMGGPMMGGRMMSGGLMPHAMMGAGVRSERQYLTTMIAHHQEAVAAATELERSDRPEMRAFGRDIVDVQTAQIEQMQRWLAEWYPDAPPPTYHPMMRDLGDLSGDELDQAFLEDMVSHHMAAVMMSQSLLVRGLVRHEAVGDLAVDIRDAQRAEIVQMTTWLRQWFGEPWMGGGMMRGAMMRGARAW
ncbi:MAG: DUF305 domain-containing protein [Nocardioides sp.]|nr:DUF305 domain-containing protein [Nocardioides sp.]